MRLELSQHQNLPRFESKDLDFYFKWLDYSEVASPQGARELSRFGVCYQGSKNKIAKKIIELLPKRKYFVDLFAGGCAMSHCALISNKYEKIILNDTNADILRLFKNAIAGKYKGRDEFVSKKEYYERKNSDEFIKYLWSFSGLGLHYIYATYKESFMGAYDSANKGDFSGLKEFGISSLDEIAPALARASKFRDFLKVSFGAHKNLQKEQMREYLNSARKKAGLSIKEVIARLNTSSASHYFQKSQWQMPTRENYEKMREFLELVDFDELPATASTSLTNAFYLLSSINSASELKHQRVIAQLNELSALEGRAKDIKIFNKDYSKVSLPKPAECVIYADPPYYKTECKAYGKGAFNHAEFYGYLKKLKAKGYDIYLSEYCAPSEFKEIANFKRGGSKLTTNRVAIERLFTL